MPGPEASDTPPLPLFRLGREPSLIEASLRLQGVDVSEGFMNMWFDHMFLPTLLAKSDPNARSGESSELISLMGGFTKRLILWGSDEVLAGYVRFRKVMTGQNIGKPKPLDPKLAEPERFFLVLRKDLGYRNRGLKDRDILALFINDLNEPYAASIEEILVASTPAVGSASGRSGEGVTRVPTSGDVAETSKKPSRSSPSQGRATARRRH